MALLTNIGLYVCLADFNIKPIIEENMSDSQVGSRSNKSIRNHIFVVNTVINAVVKKVVKPVDILIYDCKSYDIVQIQVLYV